METLQRIYLTAHLSITRNENEIIDCLVDHGEMPANFDASQVTTFYSGEDLHLVLYFAHQYDRGFQMYVIEDFSVHQNELILLRDLFGRMVQEGDGKDIFRQAHYRLDSIVHMAKTLRAVIHKDIQDLGE